MCLCICMYKAYCSRALATFAAIPLVLYEAWLREHLTMVNIFPAKYKSHSHAFVTVCPQKWQICGQCCFPDSALWITPKYPQVAELWHLLNLHRAWSHLLLFQVYENGQWCHGSKGFTVGPDELPVQMEAMRNTIFLPHKCDLSKTDLLGIKTRHLIMV